MEERRTIRRRTPWHASRARSASTAAESSAGVTTAVPIFMTTTLPAKLASSAASSGVAPAASARANVASTVSPGARHVGDLVGAVDRDQGRASRRSEKSAIPREPRVTRRLPQRILARSARGGLGERRVRLAERAARALLELLLVGRRGVDVGELGKPMARVDADARAPRERLPQPARRSTARPRRSRSRRAPRLRRRAPRRGAARRARRRPRRRRRAGASSTS